MSVAYHMQRVPPTMHLIQRWWDYSYTTSLLIINVVRADHTQNWCELVPLQNAASPANIGHLVPQWTSPGNTASPANIGHLVPQWTSPGNTASPANIGHLVPQWSSPGNTVSPANIGHLVPSDLHYGIPCNTKYLMVQLNCTSSILSLRRSSHCTQHTIKLSCVLGSWA